MAEKISYTRDEKIVIIYVLVSYFMANVCMDIAAPFLPRQCELRGLKPSVAGWMLGFSPLTQTVACFIGSRLVVKLGVRNMLISRNMIMGLLLGAFGCLEFVPTDQPAAFVIIGFVLRFTLAIGSGFTLMSGTTIITERFFEKGLFLLSLCPASGSAGIVSSLAIGGFLFEAAGFWLVFVLPAAVIVTVALSMLLLLPHNDLKRPANLKDRVPYRQILLDPKMLVLLSACFFCGVSWSGLDPILEPELRSSFGLSEAQSSLIFCLMAVMSLFGCLATGKMLGKPGCTDIYLVMIVALVIQSAAFMLIGPSPILGDIPRPLWLAITCIATIGFFYTVYFVPTQGIILDVKRLKLPATTDQTAVTSFLSSCLTSAMIMGMFAGMSSSGMCKQFLGWRWTTTVYAFIGVLLAILVAALKLSETGAGFGCSTTDADADESEPLLKTELE